MEGVGFARLIELPLAAHLTVEWSLTDVGDDPDGKLFAKVREGLDKWLGRREIVFAGVWARECRPYTEIVHCHLLFYLPVEYRTGHKLRQVEDAVRQLVELHGEGIQHEKAVDLRVHEDPDGKYLIKGGGPEVWKRFRVRKEHRRLQGMIYGKRCGTTENIGLAARRRWEQRLDGKNRCASSEVCLWLPG